nr:hypothetical protein 1 [ssRNA positive-strand virus sp.]
MYSLLVLKIFISFCCASVLKVELLRDLYDSGSSPELFYKGLNFSFGNSYSVGYSPYRYDPRCVSVHRTNSLLYVGCQLPRRCGTPMAHIFDKNIFGQETVLCYSFHDRFQSNLRYSEFDIFHYDISLEKPFSRSSLTKLLSVRPVTLSENFYLLFNNSYVALLPRICTMFYPSQRVESVTSYITIEGDSDEVCVEVPSIKHMQCVPRWFDGLDSLMKHYNYPVSYAGAPNDGETSLDTNLNGAVALYEMLRTDDNYTIVSHRSGRYFASYFSLDSAITVIPLRFPPLYEEKLCMRVDSAYVNPVSTMFHYIMSQLEYILSEILDVFSGSIEEILRFIVRVAVKLVDVILDMVPYPMYFLTALFIFAIFYFYLSNFYRSLCLSLISYVFQIYINDSIKN